MTNLAVSSLITFLSARRINQLDVSDNHGIGPIGATLLLEFCCLAPNAELGDGQDKGSHLEVLVMSDINLGIMPPFQAGIRNHAQPICSAFPTMTPYESYRDSTFKRLRDSITNVMAAGDCVLYSLDVSNNTLDPDIFVALQLAACKSRSVVHFKLANTKLTKEVAFDVLPGLLASTECNLQALDVGLNPMCGVRQASFDPRPVQSLAEQLTNCTV